MRYVPLVEIEIEQAADAERRGGMTPSRLGFAPWSEPVVIDDGTAQGRRFGPGLIDLDIPGRATDFYGGSQSDRGASITLALDVFDAVALRARGVELQRLRVNVWWWPEDDAWNRALLLWRGEVREPQIDPTERVVVLSTDADTRERDVAFPPGILGDLDRFPFIPAANTRVPRSIVIGVPLEVPLYAVSDDSGVSTVRLFIAGHRIVDEQITVEHQGAVVGSYAVGLSTDGRGDLFSYVDIPPGDWPGPDSACYASGVQGYGPAGLESLVTNLGDVLEWLVRAYAFESNRDLDMQRISAARVALNRYRVSAVINATTTGSILRLLKSRFEGQFPVAFNFAAGRFGWDYIGPTGWSSEPIGHIIWNQVATTRGRLVETSRNDVRSRFEVAYLQLFYSNGYQGSVRADELTHAKLRASFAKWGVEAAHRIEAPDAAEEATAWALLEDEVLRRAGVRTRITYGNLPADWIVAPLMARVLVTDPDLGLDEAPFFLESVTPDPFAGVTVGLISADLR